ncbi:putative membrane protein [Planktothrix serta PCC 8927]|uniref:Membrane protein n=1 Tax=Planktothrix serta PCC 8927 TaxID=671068 RepID=A0A7Z9C2Q6_9CYAN|nr:hypothetical protein [Planktothrix serta]VXD24106.1 putative membrane protein [Planktothrix serta PCC 8927]
MNAENYLEAIPLLDWICPDLTPYWKLAKSPNSDRIILKAKNGSVVHTFSALEGFALRYFTGQFTVSKVQKFCQKEVENPLDPNFVIHLLQKLIDLNILSPEHQQTGIQLKTCVHWIEHPDGYWILRNPEDVKFIQVSQQDKTIIDQLEYNSPEIIAAEFCISQSYIRQLLQLLTVTGMLEGTTPPPPPKRKFNPMQLLYFRIPLFNPDFWLTQKIDKIRWIWSQFFTILLILFLTLSGIIGYSQTSEIILMGEQLINNAGSSLIIPLGLLTLLVVTLHELGHAFTLKHYGGIVPEIGLLMIMFMPAAYTNTTDSYCLVKRYQRVLVVAAGVLVQLIIAAIGLLLWNWSNPSSALYTTSYLLMTAALLTIALNLNPLSKFDGYYLMVALTGINNLRSRSFQFYKNLLTGKPIHESPHNTWFLAFYAPFSFLYIYFVLGFLWIRILDWFLVHIPTLFFMLLTLWLIYYFMPNKKPGIKKN